MNQFNELNILIKILWRTQCLNEERRLLLYVRLTRKRS